MTTGSMTANATIATTVSPAWYARAPDERRDPDDQLAVPEHRRRGELPGLGEARQRHADRGERGEDGMPGLDRDPAEQQVHAEGDRDEADHHRQRQDEIAPGRGDAPAGKARVGLDREHDEHAENEDDGEVRQAERPESGDGVPGQRETAKPQRNTAGALRAGSDLVVLSTGFSFVGCPQRATHTPRGSRRRSWDTSGSEGRTSFRPAHACTTGPPCAAARRSACVCDSSSDTAILAGRPRSAARRRERL